MPLCPVALIMFAHSSATVWTLLECRGDDVILFYFQQEVKLQRSTGRARGTRTSLVRMGYVHIHAVLSHTFLLDCLRLVMRAVHRGVTYLRWNCGDTSSALNSATRYFSCNKCVSFLCSVNVSSRKAFFWFTSGFVSPFTAVKLKKIKIICVASLVHFSLTWALIKLSLGMYTWQHDAFWMIICCQDIVLDIEMQITYS